MVNARRAKPGKFAEIDTQTKPSTKDVLVEYLMEDGKISATQAEEELGINRGEASHILSKDSRFEYVGTSGHRKLYGLVKTDAN